MTTLLENFIISHLAVTLSHMDYGHHFHLGSTINIMSSPTQCLQLFVETKGSPYRFIIVGKLMSFKVAEDTVCAESAFLPPQKKRILT